MGTILRLEESSILFTVILPYRRRYPALDQVDHLFESLTIYRPSSQYPEDLNDADLEDSGGVRDESLQWGTDRLTAVWQV
jgi:hypothetical protein